MNQNKFLIFITILILFIAGFNGFLIEENLLKINRSILSLILDGSILLIGILSIQKARQIGHLIIILLAFLITTLISYLLNYRDLSAILFFNGLREFIPYFFFPIIFINFFQSSQRINFIKKFNVFLYIFLIIQIPVSLYQFSIDGAGDSVGGTQGNGFSGNLTIIVFLATYYLMVQDFDEKNIIVSFLKKSYLLIFWLPAFINETKISFVFIIVFFILLNKISYSNVYKYIVMFLILIPFLLIFNSIYEKTTSNSINNDFLNEDFLVEYLASDDEIYQDIPRFQKIAIYLAMVNTKDAIIGKGIGQFKGGTTVNLTPFAEQYYWLLSGSVAMFFFLFVQTGIIGTVLFIFYWIRLIITQENKNRTGYAVNIIIFATFSFIVIQFYNVSFRSLFFCGIIMYSVCYAIFQKKSHKVRIIDSNSKFKY